MVSNVSMAATISSGSDMRPGPYSLQAMGAVIGADEVDAALAQRLDVGDGGRMRPHAHVHRRCHQDGLVGGEQHGRGEIVGETTRHARQDVGGGRRHDQQVGLTAEFDMAPSRFRR